MSVETNSHNYTNMNLIFSQFVARQNSAKTKSRSPRGFLPRPLLRAGESIIPPPLPQKDRGRPRRPAHQSRATQKSFLFLLEEKIGCAQIQKCKENFFVGRAGLRHGGGAASLVPFKVGSSKVYNYST